MSSRNVLAIVLVAFAVSPKLADLEEVLTSLSLGEVAGPVVTSTPSAELQQAVAPLRAVLATHPQRQRIAAFFLECADEVAANPQLATLEQIRAFNAKAGAAMVRRAGAAEGLGKLLSESLKSVAGDEPVAVDANLRSKIADWYRAVAWAAAG